MFFPSRVFRRCQTSPVVRLGVHWRCLRTSGNGLPQQYRKTHYETLGLTSTASQEEIKSAYYNLSMKYHPDKNKGAEEKFKDITTAYEVLGNPRMRRLYDRGIISHNDDDDTISQYAGGDTATSEKTMSDHTETTRVSAANYDKWSKQQATQAFYRTQTAKKQRHHFSQSKSRNAEDTSAENLVWVIFVLGLFAIGYSQVGSLGSSKKPKEP